MPTIQEAVQAAAPGDIVKIPAGVYDVSDLVLPSDITLQADGDATLVGNLIVNGSNTVVQGFTFDGGFVDLWNSHGATVRDCVFNGGDASVKFSSADGALITSNDFNNVAGNALDGWDLNQSTISGNHFTHCWQGINLDFNNDPTRGNDIVVDHNTFIDTGRMPIEVGPGETARTSNLVISNNWSDNSHVTDQASDGAVAYSIISTYGDHTLIDGNYAVGPSGPGIGIELAGSGEISNNSIDTFEFGIIVYGSGFNVHDNATANTPIESVLNYSGGDGVIQNNIADAEGLDLAANAHYGQSSDEGSIAALLDTGTPAEQQLADGGLDAGWQSTAADGSVQADGADAQDVASQWIDPAPLDAGTSAEQQLADGGLDAGWQSTAADGGVQADGADAQDVASQWIDPAPLDTGTSTEQQLADVGFDPALTINADDGGVQADGADAQDVASQWIDPAPLDTGTSAEPQLADVGLDAALAINGDGGGAQADGADVQDVASQWIDMVPQPFAFSGCVHDYHLG